MNGSANSATTGAPDMITSTIRRDETPQCAAVKNSIKTRKMPPSMKVAVVNRAKRYA